VTSKIPQVIRLAAGSIAIQEYLMHCIPWTEDVLNDIHWEAIPTTDINEAFL
jgi:hypothetical protein